MKEKKHGKELRCPGCSKHCPLSAPKCKYGCRYAQKCAASAAANCAANGCKSTDKHSRKWKKRVEKGGLLHLLLKTGKRIKKGLHRDSVTEEKLLSMLAPSEKESLEAILRKLESCAK